MVFIYTFIRSIISIFIPSTPPTRATQFYYPQSPRYRPVWGSAFAPVPEYNQAHLPVRQQTKAEGHAVHAVYLYCAMADVAPLTGDKELLASCKTLWDNMTRRRMYITGGIGSSGYFERFTSDWDLPNDSAYCETCASVGASTVRAAYGAHYPRGEAHRCV